MVYQSHTESDLYEQIARYLSLKHPEVVYHFDLSGVWTPSHKARNLYARLNKRAWPDLWIAEPVQGYAGLAIELKRDGTKLKKRDGSWATPHIAEQAAVLEQLAQRNYIAQFAVGFDEAVQFIESYLNDADAAAWSGDDYWTDTRRPTPADTENA